MKKLFISLMLLCTTTFLFAQDSEPLNNDYTYAQIVGTAKLFSKKVKVSIDFGQEQKLFENNFLKGEDGKPMVFNSMIDALNFMGDQGWEFVQAYAITVSNQNVYHYLMKKRKE